VGAKAHRVACKYQLDGGRLADNIKRIAPLPHCLIMFLCFTGGLCSHDQPDIYWVEEFGLPSLPTYGITSCHQPVTGKQAKYA